MGLSLLFPLGINTSQKKQLLIYHNYGDVTIEQLLKKLLLNQKTGTVVPFFTSSGTVIE